MSSAARESELGGELLLSRLFSSLGGAHSLPNALGNALGNGIVDEMQAAEAEREKYALVPKGKEGLRPTAGAVQAWNRQVYEGIASSAAAMRGDWTTDGIVAADGATVYDNGSSPQAVGGREGDLLAANGVDLRTPSSQQLTMLPRELQALRDPAVRADPAKLRSLYNVALDNSRAWLPVSLSPEETSLTTGVAYQKVFGEDRTAIWFGLAPYATSKVGETYQQLDKFYVDLVDKADAGIIRQGFPEGNRAIFESMFTAEQFYQAGGTEAIRAMVQLDRDSFGASWTRENRLSANSLVESFELRDQAKAAFAAGQSGKGEMLLGQSLRASADFEQRVVLQQYYDKSYTASTLRGGSETKTLRQAIQGMADLGPRAIAEYMSTVTINGQSLSFTGRDVGDVNQRMPFVYSLAGNLMKTYSSDGSWLSGSQRIYQDQFNVLQRTYGADAMFSVRRRLGF